LKKSNKGFVQEQFEPGTAPAGMIPLCIPEIRGREWQYVKDCLDTGWVSSAGQYVNRFESNMAAHLGCTHAVATMNGTAALHISLLVAGVEPDDEVLVSTLTFIAPANTVRYAGAWPVFIDAEPKYWQMDPEKVVQFIENDCKWSKGELRNKKTGRRVRAIMPVHILGHPVDMDPIIKIARERGLVVIEDATESLGAKYKGHNVGHLGDLACFSFNGNKVITCGSGGMVVTDNAEWAQRTKYLTTQAKDDPVEYIHNEIGYNQRLPNLLAAMGCAQLEMLDDYVQRKRAHADAYSAGLAGVPGIRVMPHAEWAFSTYWMYTVLVDKQQYGMSSRELLRALAEAGIQTRPLWQPLHCAPPYRNCQVINSGVAEQLNRDALSLPCSVGLTDEVRSRVIQTIQSLASQS
jgi:perosamine synthetase